jgi:hypothetical protein
MSMRYFYYISKSKVQMLRGQIGSISRLSKLNPKVEGFGLGVEFGIESEAEEGGDAKLAQDTNELIKRLTKSKLVVSLKDALRLDESNFYHDEDVWSHGLYSLKQSDTNSYMITYMLWKASRNRIFLLFGSPVNVLGAREVNEGMEHRSGSSTIINDVIESSLQDEFMGAIYDCGKVDSSEKPSVMVLPGQDSAFKINVSNWTPSARFAAKRNVLRGTALAVLCRDALKQLPTAKIETMFKIYHALPVSRSIAPFDMLYLGSPIYTALV